MTYINFVMRDPQNTKLASVKMANVPRIGEAVAYEDRVFDVHMVTWNLTTNSVTVVLR